MTSACKYNDFCMRMCEWTNCPDKYTRFAYLPLSVLLAFVAVEIAVSFGNGTCRLACSCHNADGGWTCVEWHERSTRSTRQESIISFVALRVENYTFKALLHLNDNVFWVGYICMLTNPWSQDTSIKWTPEIVPRVSGLAKFHCIIIISEDHYYLVFWPDLNMISAIMLWVTHCFRFEWQAFVLLLLVYVVEEIQLFWQRLFHYSWTLIMLW